MNDKWKKVRREGTVENLSQISLIETVMFRNSIVYGNYYELRVYNTANVRKI